MKWFKHDTDMHTDFKIQALVDKYHSDGYMIWCLCLEILGKEGKQGRLIAETRWLQGLLKVVPWCDEGRVTEILNHMAELKLICPKALKFSNLHIPQFMKRADDWSKRVLRSNSVGTSAIDKNRIDKIRIEFTRKYELKTNQPYVVNWSRDTKTIKELLGSLSDEELLRRIDRYFSINDPWLKEHGYTLTNLQWQINKLGVTPEKKAMPTL